MIHALTPSQVCDSVEKIKSMLERVVLPEDGFTLEGELAYLLQGDLVAWSVNDFQALVVTQIWSKPLFRVLFIKWVVGSKMKDWLGDWVRVQEEYARLHGCAMVETQVKQGLVRLFARHFPEYKASQTVLQRFV